MDSDGTDGIRDEELEAFHIACKTQAAGKRELAAAAKAAQMLALQTTDTRERVAGHEALADAAAFQDEHHYVNVEPSGKPFFRRTHAMSVTIAIAFPFYGVDDAFVSPSQFLIEVDRRRIQGAWSDYAVGNFFRRSLRGEARVWLLNGLQDSFRRAFPHKRAARDTSGKRILNNWMFLRSAFRAEFHLNRRGKPYRSAADSPAGPAVAAPAPPVSAAAAVSKEAAASMSYFTDMLARPTCPFTRAQLDGVISEVAAHMARRKTNAAPPCHVQGERPASPCIICTTFTPPRVTRGPRRPRKGVRARGDHGPVAELNSLRIAGDEPTSLHQVPAAVNSLSPGDGVVNERTTTLVRELANISGQYPAASGNCLLW
jgi:hypothetical protein